LLASPAYGENTGVPAATLISIIIEVAPSTNFAVSQHSAGKIKSSAGKTSAETTGSVFGGSEFSGDGGAGDGDCGEGEIGGSPDKSLDSTRDKLRAGPLATQPQTIVMVTNAPNNAKIFLIFGAI
jgi:hypothetical protein